jgi:hypothetical protein
MPWVIENTKFYGRGTPYGEFALSVKIPREFSIVKKDVVTDLKDGIFTVELPAIDDGWANNAKAT